MMTALLHPNRAPQPTKPPRKTFVIDPLAFVLALVSAPLFVAFLGFWAMFIPVAGIFYGGPLYLIFGTPALLWFLPRYGSNALGIALLAALVNFGASFSLFILPELVGLDEIIFHDREGIYLMFGTPLAFFWGLAFGWLYPKFERAEYRVLNADFTPR